MKKGSILIVFVLIIQVILTEACCPDPVTFCFEPTSIIIKNKNNEGIETMDQMNDSIPALAYALEVNLSLNEVSCASNRGNLVFMNSAYALSCVNDVYQLKDKIIDYKIYTTAHFNTSENNVEITEHFVSKSTINEMNLDREYIFSEISNTFYLFTVPEITEEHKIYVDFEFSNGVTLTDTTDIVILTP